MLGRIIEWSVRNVFLVLLATFFLVAAGVYAVINTPLDAIPDLSDVQVIIYSEYPGQAPQVVEDQVTYPLSTAMLAVPKSKVVRGLSGFGASFVYVIFEDGTDIYWARSRVLEYLNFASGRLPRGINPSLGPDATGVGWVFQYAVVGAGRSLAELRSIQDWYVRYQLTKAQGVAEVASVGGFVKNYQVTVDPRKLQAYGIPLNKLAEVIRPDWVRKSAWKRFSVESQFRCVPAPALRPTLIHEPRLVWNRIGRPQTCSSAGCQDVGRSFAH